MPAAPLNRISSSAVVEFELADREVRSKVDVVPSSRSTTVSCTRV